MHVKLMVSGTRAELYVDGDCAEQLIPRLRAPVTINAEVATNGSIGPPYPWGRRLGRAEGLSWRVPRPSWAASGPGVSAGQRLGPPLTRLRRSAHPPSLQPPRDGHPRVGITENFKKTRLRLRPSRRASISEHHRRTGRAGGVRPRSLHLPVAVTDGSATQNFNENGVRLWTDCSTSDEPVSRQHAPSQTEGI